MTKRKLRASRLPHPNTFAAWVMSQSPDELPKSVATRARASGYPETKPSHVSSVRYYYSSVDCSSLRARAPEAPPASTVRGTVTRAQRAPDDVPDELAVVITRFGTDAVRRALAHVEVRAMALAASAGGAA